MKTFAGIDVGAKTLVLAWRRDGRTRGQASFEQSPQGHRALVKRLRALAPELVVLEATGVYYLDVAVALVQAELPVAVINPRSFHHFAKLKLGPSKTDGLDAPLLAEYAERLEPPRWRPPEPTRLALRDLGRQLNRLTATRTQAKNRLHALRAKRISFTLLLEDEGEAIAALDRRIERLTQAAYALLAQHQELAAQAQWLQSAKGVGRASTIALLGELAVLPPELRGAQLARHAGLDVRLCQSGTSVHKAPRISKAGNAYLRAALYMPALCAVRHDPRAGAFYQALQRRGKRKLQALCAVMRKLLTGLWACLKNHQPFDSSKLFSDIHLNPT